MSDVVKYWDSLSKEDRQKLLTSIGVHAYFITEMRQCCLDNMGKMLIDITKLFHENNLHYWLDFGALLGLVRAGELIQYDKDIDIGIFDEDIPKYNALGPKIEALGYRFTAIKQEDFYSVDRFVPRIHFGHEKTHCARICACDIFVWHNVKKRQPRKCILLNDAQFCTCNSTYFEETEWFNWKGHQIKVPKNPASYLQMRYGPKWRLADPLYYRNNRIGSE